jgi:subtilisin family serine protease
MQLGPGSAVDGDGHGTHVSGIVTGRGTVAPIGGAPDARVVAIRVFDAMGNGLTADPIMALNHILAAEPDVKVVNMSLGTTALFVSPCDLTDAVTIAYAAAIDMLRARGTLVIAASGNDASSTRMNAPGCIANAVAVGATYDDTLGQRTWPNAGPPPGCTDAVTRVDQIACFSNIDAHTDLLAPGSAVISTAAGGGVATDSGTSQATPLVTACAAVLLEHDPTLTPAAIEAVLEASPVRIRDPRNGVVVPRLDCQLALVRLGAGRTCNFDVNGDGIPDLVLHDTDGDGLCELPAAKTHLYGTFTSDTPIEIRGNTVLEADRIVIEPGGVIFGEQATLRSLRLVATTGAIESTGRIDLKASDDLFVRAATAVLLEGRTELVAADIVDVDARRGDLRLLPPVMQTPFAALGGNRATLRSKGSVGVIAVGRARVGGPRVYVEGVANVSVVGTNGVVVTDRGIFTSDPAPTFLPAGGGDVSVSTTGRVVLSGRDVLDATRTLRIATARPGDDLCLELQTLLEARSTKGVPGRIDLTRVRGAVRDDGTTTFVGTLASNGIVAGVCP